MDEIVNRVAKSGLITIDLEEWQAPGKRLLFDIAPYLWQGMVLKEKPFREGLKNHNWEVYRNNNVAVFCSEDAIVPTWAYMLVVTYLEGIARKVVYGNIDDLEAALYQDKFDELDPADYQDARIVIKGCSEKRVPVASYVALTRLLQPVARSIMYGEPCSTVPLYKKAK